MKFLLFFIQIGRVSKRRNCHGRYHQFHSTVCHFFTLGGNSWSVIKGQTKTQLRKRNRYVYLATTFQIVFVLSWWAAMHLNYLYMGKFIWGYWEYRYFMKWSTEHSLMTNSNFLKILYRKMTTLTSRGGWWYKTKRRWVALPKLTSTMLSNFQNFLYW